MHWTGGQVQRIKIRLGDAHPVGRLWKRPLTQLLHHHHEGWQLNASDSDVDASRDLRLLDCPQ